MNKRILLIIVLGLIVGVIFFISNPFQKNPASPSTTGGIVQPGQKSSEIGQKAFDFETEDFAGEKVKLSEFAGKPVFIDFWAAWCPFCIEEMPEIEKVHQEFGDKWIVLGIHRTDTEGVDKGGQFAKERGVTYRLLKDPTGQIYKNFTGGRNFMPYAIYLDKEGVIQKIKAGPKTAEEIRKAVNQLTL